MDTLEISDPELLHFIARFTDETIGSWLQSLYKTIRIIKLSWPMQVQVISPPRYPVLALAGNEKVIKKKRNDRFRSFLYKFFMFLN